jgi:hypothetical protein
MDEAKALAQSIAKQPPHALRVTKQLLKQGTQSTYDAIMEMSANAQGLMHHTKDQLIILLGSCRCASSRDLPCLLTGISFPFLYFDRKIFCFCKIS